VNELLLVSSFIIDIVFGDPSLIFTHPVAIIGRLIGRFEEFFVFWGGRRKGTGILFTIFIIAVVLIFVKLLLLIFNIFNQYLNFLLIAIFGSFAISLRSLHYETSKVVSFLYRGDMVNARRELALLVSRDTNELEERDIVRSLIETISENLTDGVIAPLFYYAIGGVLGAFFYKTVNTLDSMIGYKNDKYFEFGYFAAKLDDILNFIPARIAGLLVVVSSFLLGYNYKNSFKILIRDRKNCDSPNSGWTESAFAGALNIQLGGPTPYFGVWYDKPFIGDEFENLSLIHIKKSYKLLYLTSIIFVVLLLIFFKS
jgi:adenosylcobinamide-phosphate synthase